MWGLELRRTYFGVRAVAPSDPPRALCGGGHPSRKKPEPVPLREEAPAKSVWRAMPSEENSASKNWERYVGILVGQGRTIFGAAVLPIAPDQPTLRK